MGFEHFRMHPQRPVARRIQRAAERIRQGGFVVLPTDGAYAMVMACDAFDAQQQVRRLRRLDERHLWSLLCEDLSQAAAFVRIDNRNHRILRRYLPGPYTFVLPASSRMPRRVLKRRREVGIRMPDAPILRMLQEELAQALLATTMQMPDAESPMTDPEEMAVHLRHMNATLIDAGDGGVEPSTVVDLTGEVPRLIRQGLGPWP